MSVDGVVVFMLEKLLDVVYVSFLDTSHITEITGIGFGQSFGDARAFVSVKPVSFQWIEP
jgi:hypothetical protein